MNSFSWALAAALAWGIAPILEKVGLQRVPNPTAGLFYRCVGVLIGMVLIGVFFVKPEEVRAIDGRSIFFLILGGFVASIVGQMCFYNALKVGEVSRVVPISGSYHVIAFVLGLFIFRESLTPVKVLGVALIISGVSLLKIA